MSGTIAYFDVFVGASGDMILGALVDAGLPPDALLETIAALGLENAVEARVEKVHKGAIAATKVTLITHGEPDRPHTHLRLPHTHHEHAHEHEHEHPHRSLSEILDIIGRARLPEEVKSRAQAVFQRLAEAEARVHGMDTTDVHFHEVGALDAIVDVVGTVAGLHTLGVEQVVVSPIPLTHGYVDTAHGRLPIPAPATLLLLEGVPVRGLDLEAETVTPTGAALLATLADGFGPVPPMTVRRVGHGAGMMDLPLPNVLRLLLGEEPTSHKEPLDAQPLVVLSTNVDDMPGEWFGPLFEDLLAAGAWDVWFTPVQMKKGRPGIVISLVAPPEQAATLRRLLLERTTTLGVREEHVTRWCLPRETHTVSTPWGPVRVKVARLPNGATRAKPEFDDCLALARAHNISLHDVYRAALRAFQHSSQERPSES